MISLSLAGEKGKQLAECESRQKKMTAAIEAQNDEICALKRERESLKARAEELRRAIDVTLTALNQGLKGVKEDVVVAK